MTNNPVSHQLQSTYHEADLVLEFDESGSAQLKINGLTRETASLGSNATGNLRLGSPVQTDYEWHEYIEGFVSYQEQSISARLTASQIELTSTTIRRPS